MESIILRFLLNISYLENFKRWFEEIDLGLCYDLVKEFTAGLERRTSVSAGL